MTLELGIAGISSMAARHVLADLAAGYSRDRVTIEAVGGVDAQRRLENGERFDFAVLAEDAIDRLAASGRVVAATRVIIARSGIAVAVRAGAARVDIATESAVRAAVSTARAIGTSSGPSGRYLTQLFARWGVAPRVVEAPPGIPVASLLAAGEVELGFQQSSELVHVPGIDVLGPLPDAIQVVTAFVGAVCAASNRPEKTREFLDYCTAPASVAVKQRHGMQP